MDFVVRVGPSTIFHLRKHYQVCTIIFTPSELVLCLLKKGKINITTKVKDLKFFMAEYTLIKIGPVNCVLSTIKVATKSP